MAELRRVLRLFDVTLAGIGLILGAGIYTLIGIAASSSGNATWLSFLISAIIVIFTGLSYAELSSIFKGNAGEYNYLSIAFNRKFALLTSLSIIFAGFTSASAVALGFAFYLSSLIKIPIIVGAVLLILLMTFINFKGIKESNRFNKFSTMVEFAGLIIIILLGITKFGSVNYLEMPNGFSGVFSSAALIFFAYLGFEGIIKLSDETKNPQKIIPKALIYSILITAVVYILVAISAVSVIGWEELANSKAPLATVASAVFGPWAFFLLGIIALFSTSNTVLIILVTTSRMIYGMAKTKSLPFVFSKVHEKTRTPYIAILSLMAASILFVLIGNLKFIANLTNLFLFFTFASVNLGLIVLRYKCRYKKRGFVCPGNIGKFSVIALFGFLSSLFMFVYVIFNLITI